jgi:hypothetical protein
MRKSILFLLVTAVMVVSSAVVHAGPPIAGTYKSTDGDFDEGTATTGWDAGGYLGTGNVFFARATSIDWTIGCSTVTAAVLLVPKFGPNGQEIWQITYAPGAAVNLSGPGNPWDGGDAVYVGITDYQNEIRTVQYVNNAVVGAVSDHSLGAHLPAYPQSCVLWGIGNGVLRGGTPPGNPPFTYPTLQSVKPAGYVGFPVPGAPTCTLAAPGVGTGHWDDIRDLTISITGCAVATQQSTWGNVKAMYRK